MNAQNVYMCFYT